MWSPSFVDWLVGSHVLAVVLLAGVFFPIWAVALLTRALDRWSENSSGSLSGVDYCAMHYPADHSDDCMQCSRLALARCKRIEPRMQGVSVREVA